MNAMRASMSFMSCRRIGAALAVLLAALAPAGVIGAEPLFSFDAAPGKLTKAVAPAHYAIELEPDLKSLTFTGRETVDVELREATAQITLNAVDMSIAEVTADGEAGPAAVTLDVA